MKKFVLEHGGRIERFGVGKDSGIDLRYYDRSGGVVIVQCKHYAKNSFRKLCSDMIKKERPKIDALNPGRYILVTSLSLQPANKIRLAEALAPHVKRSDDIYGCEDLNSLLDKHNDVFEKFLYVLNPEAHELLVWIAGTELRRAQMLQSDRRWAYRMMKKVGSRGVTNHFNDSNSPHPQRKRHRQSRRRRK